MLNIIACKKIAYQNAYKMPNITFVVGDLFEIEINHCGLMASSVRKGYYSFPTGKDPIKANGRGYVFGHWVAGSCGSRKAVLSEIKGMTDFAIDYDCHVFAYKKALDDSGNLVGIETRVLGMDDDGNYIDVDCGSSTRGSVIDTKDWTIVYTAKELAENVLDTLEPLLKKAREFETATATARAENRARVAELKKKIKADQKADLPIENKVLDPNEWWASLTDQDKINLATK